MFVFWKDFNVTSLIDWAWDSDLGMNVVLNLADLSHLTSDY